MIQVNKISLYFFAALISSAIIISSCTKNKYSKIISFYKKNPELHKAIADTLLNYLKTHNTSHVTLHQNNSPDSLISFGYTFDNISTQIGIGFDQSLNRIDVDERTKQIDVPVKLIADFKKTIYYAVITKEAGVFFGYEYRSSMSKFVYGILIYDDEAKIDKGNVLKKIAPGVCVYEAVIP